MSMHRDVFVSYRRLDDVPPPETQDRRRGFVSYLLRQLRWELGQLGVPDANLWQDCVDVELGDVFTEEIRKALDKAELYVAILSRNYVTSEWCTEELSTMEKRIAKLDAKARQRRIFRVDKHSVPDHEVPIQLRSIQAVKFYREDDEQGVNEYYWRGKVRRKRDYENAVHDLAKAICKRLNELGIDLRPQVPSALGLNAFVPRLDNGRVVFVAKPARDMDELYQSLVRELHGRGFRITPDPEKELSGLGEDVGSAIVSAVAEAEASIHLLGERTGGRPCGLNMDLVPMQLAAAADEAKRKPGFLRMIWAPAVLPPESAHEGTVTPRDPLSVGERFGEQLPTDEIVGDTATRFYEFVIQRLERRGRKQ